MCRFGIRCYSNFRNIVGRSYNPTELLSSDIAVDPYDAGFFLLSSLVNTRLRRSRHSVCLVRLIYETHDITKSSPLARHKSSQTRAKSYGCRRPSPCSVSMCYVWMYCRYRCTNKIVHITIRPLYLDWSNQQFLLTEYSLSKGRY